MRPGNKNKRTTKEAVYLREDRGIYKNKENSSRELNTIVVTSSDILNRTTDNNNDLQL